MCFRLRKGFLLILVCVFRFPAILLGQALKESPSQGELGKPERIVYLGVDALYLELKVRDGSIAAVLRGPGSRDRPEGNKR